jgi:hypothetical protein
MAIQAGIARIVAPLTDNKRWEKAFNFDLSKQMFKEANVEVDLVSFL